MFLNVLVRNRVHCWTFIKLQTSELHKSKQCNERLSKLECTVNVVICGRNIVMCVRVILDVVNCRLNYKQFVL